MTTSTQLPIGFTYKVIENGRKVQGEVVGYKGEFYRVRWDDGEETIEDRPDPSVSWVRSRWEKSR